MFNVYLLEDNENQRIYYRRIIENYIMINDYSMKVKSTGTVEEFYKEFEQQQYGLFFLDMEIDEDTKAGLKVADNVRRKMPDAKIVFITTHDELSFLTLERRISPMDYILKDNESNILRERIIKDIDLTRIIIKSLSTKKRIFLAIRLDLSISLYL